MSEEKMKNEIPCCLVRDLLPLYAEGLTQEETGEAVKDHISRCTDCAQALGMQQAQLEYEKARTKNDQKVVSFLKSIVYKRVLIIALSVLAVLATAIIAMGWLNHVEAVPAEDIAVAGKYQLPDGRIMIAIQTKGLNPNNFHFLNTLEMSVDHTIHVDPKAFGEMESVDPRMLGRNQYDLSISGNYSLRRSRWNSWFRTADQRGDTLYLLFDPLHYSANMFWSERQKLTYYYDWDEDSYPLRRVSINGHTVWTDTDALRQVTEEEAALLLAAYEAQKLDAGDLVPRQDVPDALNELLQAAGYPTAAPTPEADPDQPQVTATPSPADPLRPWKNH